MQNFCNLLSRKQYGNPPRIFRKFSEKGYGLPQIHFEYEAPAKIPNGSFKPFVCKSTIGQY